MWIPIGIALGLALIFVLIFNTLVARKNQVRNVFATIDAMLKKRWDLVPNLVSTVEGYMEHERELLEELTRARASVAGGPRSSDAAVAADNRVTKAFGSFLARSLRLKIR